MVFLRQKLLFIVVLMILGVNSDLFSLSSFSRVYNPYNGVTIDLVSDTHLKNHTLRQLIWKNSTPAVLENCLHPTENQFIEVLKMIDSGTRFHETDLIWEHGDGARLISSYNSVCFLGYPNAFVIGRLKNINYIDGDRWRQEFYKLFTLPLHLRKKGTGFASFDKPYEVTSECLSGMRERSGEQALREFQEFSAVITARLKKRLKKDNFGERYGKRSVNHTNELSALTDVEMLSHILSSTKKHIVVFAGGLHVNQISLFLQQRLGCYLIEKVRAQDASFLRKMLHLIKPLKPSLSTSFERRNLPSPLTMKAWVKLHYQHDHSGRRSLSDVLANDQGMARLMQEELNRQEDERDENSQDSNSHEDTHTVGPHSHQIGNQHGNVLPQAPQNNHLVECVKNDRALAILLQEELDRYENAGSQSTHSRSHHESTENDYALALLLQEDLPRQRNTQPIGNRTKGPSESNENDFLLARLLEEELNH